MSVFRTLPLGRILFVIHVACRYRLASLLPAHGLRPLAVLVQYLVPSSWFTPRGLSEGERLQRALDQLGPIFIKFGQLLATRRDLLPPEWTDALARLQDQVAPFPVAQARARIERELGQPIHAVFSRFDDTPLASASIAQVHSAALLDGTEVVAKIRRPGLERIVERDLAVMRFGATWLERLWRDARYFRPRRVVDDYAGIIQGELDLTAEAHNSELMRRQFLFSPLLFIPPIHMQYTTARLLVMDRIHGIPVNDIERIRAAGIDPKQLAERGVEIFFAQVFRYNFFHADMHPGNIFVNPDKPDSPQYLAVDCAIAGHLSKDDLDVLGRMVLAVMREDYTTLVDVVIRAGWTTVPVDRHRFERAVRSIVEPIRTMPLDQLEFAPLVMKLFDMARGFHIEAPVQYILLMKTLVHIEGLGRSIYPQLDIWATGRPLLESWMMDNYGPSATLRKLQARAPEWAASLPEMPDMLRDALENLRRLPQQQQQLAARMAEQQTHHRRKLLGGIAGLGLLASPLLITGFWAGAGAAAGALLLLAALRR
ncbi:MAG: ubiquinone biosynthesis protein UbiB [Alcanivorax sp.]|nr:ubiquinone biosynthesis protein UbiB [Alcanivorax sp.]